jgi:hypothetical protein
MKTYTPAILVALLACAAIATVARASTPINAVIGDRSWIARYGCAPTTGADEDLRIRVHLEYVLERLRAAPVEHLSDDARRARARCLDALEEYVGAGIFPRNRAYRGRRPCFIDDEGRLCAVGYLVATSAGLELARAIDARHQYDYIADMQLVELWAWADASGFTTEELAMIQPSYWGPGPVEPERSEALATIEIGCIAGSAAMSAVNTVLLANGTPSRTVGIIGGFAGTVTALLAIADDSRYDPFDLIAGGLSLGLGIVNVVAAPPVEGQRSMGAVWSVGVGVIAVDDDHMAPSLRASVAF